MLVAIALSTGMVALVIYYYGLKRTPARVSAICELTWPLSAVALDYVYFHKTLTATQWIGAVPFDGKHLGGVADGKKAAMGSLQHTTYEPIITHCRRQRENNIEFG